MFYIWLYIQLFAIKIKINLDHWTRNQGSRVQVRLLYQWQLINWLIEETGAESILLYFFFFFFLKGHLHSYLGLLVLVNCIAASTRSVKSLKKASQSIYDDDLNLPILLVTTKALHVQYQRKLVYQKLRRLSYFM